MSKQRKVFKFRMQPTALQADELLRMAGTARFIWNWVLERSKTFYKENQKGIAPSQLSSELTALKSKQRWLYDFDSQSLQSMLDAAFRQVLQQWKYKSLWNGTYALQADRFFPSTQLCSHCGYQNKNLSLADREWSCPECNTKHRRDHNAAQNLRDEGIRQLVALGIIETENACGQRVRPTTVGNAA